MKLKQFIAKNRSSKLKSLLFSVTVAAIIGIIFYFIAGKVFTDWQAIHNIEVKSWILVIGGTLGIFLWLRKHYLLLFVAVGIMIYALMHDYGTGASSTGCLMGWC